MGEDLPTELDFSKLKFVGRGPKGIQAAARRKLVPLDPDVARFFDDSETINQALRGPIHLAKQSARKRKKTA
jgi:hypothetical protein